MSGGRKFNKNHPDYADYLRKLQELRTAMEKESAEVEKVENYHERIALDETIDRKYFPKITQLQKDYSYLLIDLD